MRTLKQINADFEAHLEMVAARPLPRPDASPAEWAAFTRAQEADFLRRGQLYAEVLASLPSSATSMDSYAYIVARDHFNEAALTAARNAQFYEAQAAGGSR